MGSRPPQKTVSHGDAAGRGHPHRDDFLTDRRRPDDRVPASPIVAGPAIGSRAPAVAIPVPCAASGAAPPSCSAAVLGPLWANGCGAKAARVWHRLNLYPGASLCLRSAAVPCPYRAMEGLGDMAGQAVIRGPSTTGCRRGCATPHRLGHGRRLCPLAAPPAPAPSRRTRGPSALIASAERRGDRR